VKRQNRDAAKIHSPAEEPRPDAGEIPRRVLPKQRTLSLPFDYQFVAFRICFQFRFSGIFQEFFQQFFCTVDSPVYICSPKQRGHAALRQALGS
jgi:hypothetical protein